ncbi:MAG: TIGR02466 family protein [Geminicoccaceae bacterium]
MSQVNVEFRSYFATPVAVVHLPDAVELNVEISESVLARERSSAGVQHSNLGGWQSDHDFEDWGGAAGRRMLGAARQLATKLTSDRAGKPVKIAWKTIAWANVNRRGHGNEFHTHPGCFWSGTYYVDDGGIADDPKLDGAFEIQDPRGVAPAMYAPLLGFATPGGQSVGASELIHPKAGQMILFPSWLQHAVRPYHGDRTRISIAFNLSV